MITLAYTKRFTKGILKGFELNEVMKFVNEQSAELWFEGIATKHGKGRLDYYLTNLQFLDVNQLPN